MKNDLKVSDLIFYICLAAIVCVYVFERQTSKVVRVVHAYERIDSAKVFHEYLQSHRPDAARKYGLLK